MEWEAIAAYAEMLGACAVVASLLFVGYQLRQSRFIERANAQRALLMQCRDFMAIPGRDEATFEAIRTCLAEFDEADAFERERFNAWAFNFLLLFEQVVYMRQDGFVNDGSFYRFEQAMLSIIRTRGGAQWWRYSFRIIGVDVGNHLTARLEELGDTVPPWDELLPHLKRSADAA
jgi:hypothetical protein